MGIQEIVYKVSNLFNVVYLCKYNSIICDSKVLHIISNAPFYVSNNSDFNLPTVTELTKLHYKQFNKKLNHHPNPLIVHLSFKYVPGNAHKRLKTQWCRI